ncbi:MAG: hypothetical protein A2Z16_08105 [Chloroflexi bacterium RBG_16_54_18]|nr:MAG: hypothetical protein A2Z16_08105 [Chloroflexi bacterium RBG_16_54_18]
MTLVGEFYLTAAHHFPYHFQHHLVSLPVAPGCTHWNDHPLIHPNDRIDIEQRPDQVFCFSDSSAHIQVFERISWLQHVGYQDHLHHTDENIVEGLVGEHRTGSLDHHPSMAHRNVQRIDHFDPDFRPDFTEHFPGRHGCLESAAAPGGHVDAEVFLKSDIICHCVSFRRATNTHLPGQTEEGQ